VLQQGIKEKAFPGASVAVAHQGKLVALKGLGHFTYSKFASRVRPHTIYDLASLTKVVASTAMSMILYERGKFHLDQKVVEVLPEFAGRDARRWQVTFRMLLAHSSGLPAYVKLFETSQDREELLARAFAVPLGADPGIRAEYSDIGFIVLGAALERMAGEALDKFFDREILGPILDPAEPFLMGFTFARKPWAAFIPPTEYDRAYRRRPIKCEVHDENAWVMGGVAGHAGCFGEARAVATFAQCMLRGGAPLFRTHTVELFTRRETFPEGTSRALGWDTPSSPSQSGRYFSSQSYGHLGYTGTSLWNDPERQVSVTLLTNRTWPDRKSQAIKKIRPAFHDAVMQAIEPAFSR
jgi:CubicO group peptidase (beta-lactamase class C family)